MVGRVSYRGRVKQGNYHTHVLYTIPNPNYTRPKPYPFIITSAKFYQKPRPNRNDISQSLGLDLININVYAEVYQNIPLGSRDKAIFTFSEFGARQSLNR